MSSLFDRAGFTWPTREGAGQYELGTPFTVTFDGVITHLRWYRQSTSGDAPSALRVWRSSDTTVVATASSIVDGGTVGWKDCPISGGDWRPDLNVEYRVASSNPASSGLGAQSPVGVPAVPNGLAFPQAGRAYHVATPYVYPSSIEASAWDALDVIYVPDSPPPSPATTGDIEGSLTQWLSHDATAQTHDADSTPYLTWLQANGGSGFGAIKGVADAIATSVGAGIGTAVTALTTSLATANTRLTHAATTWSDALATDLQTLSDNFARFVASKSAQGGGATGSGTFPSNVGTLAWTMLAETDFAGAIAWAQPADVYVLSLTTRPHGLPLNLTDGVHTVYRAGWWTPLNGTFGRQRSYIDFEDSHLQIGAERMPGVLISLQPGGEGHVQAWALT